MMNAFRLVALIVFTGLSFAVAASETISGSGIPYTARLVFQKSDINKVANSNTHIVSIKSGDELLPDKQANSNITALAVPTIKANGWCDPAANPNITTTDVTQCYGRSSQSQWFLLDLSKLGKQKVWAQISVQKVEGSTDDYLVPALTVWRGQQNQGLTGDWYPNRFQGYSSKGQPDGSVSKSFWAWNLTPLNNTTGNLSWATASANTDKSTLNLIQPLTLKGGESNYLTVIVGSDNQETGAQNQTANFELSVILSSKKPGTSTETPTPPKYDQYNCLIGVECRHPAMGHCMSKTLCNSPQYQGQCLLCSN